MGRSMLVDEDAGERDVSLAQYSGILCGCSPAEEWMQVVKQSCINVYATRAERLLISL